MQKRQKTGGRKAGTPNKLTTDSRLKLNRIVEAELDRLPELLEQLSPNERLNAFLKLAAYVYPKLQAVEHSAGTGIQSSTPATIIFTTDTGGGMTL